MGGRKFVWSVKGRTLLDDGAGAAAEDSGAGMGAVAAKSTWLSFDSRDASWKPAWWPILTGSSSVKVGGGEFGDACIVDAMGRKQEGKHSPVCNRRT